VIDVGGDRLVAAVLDPGIRRTAGDWLRGDGVVGIWRIRLSSRTTAPIDRTVRPCGGHRALAAPFLRLFGHRLGGYDRRSRAGTRQRCRTRSLFRSRFCGGVDRSSRKQSFGGEGKRRKRWGVTSCLVV